MYIFSYLFISFSELICLGEWLESLGNGGGVKGILILIHQDDFCVILE